MRRNPWFIAFSIIGVVVVLVVVAALAAMYTAFGDRSPSLSSNSVMVLEVRGVIVDSRPTIKLLEKYRENKDVKAIVVRLDSPGGVVGPSQEIYDEVLKTRRLGKHVIASMGS